MSKKCFRCGAALKEKESCKKCGAKYSFYQKAEQISNQFYNIALEKAKTRDLSGACDILKQCLRLNKRQKDARNLLGLIYFEMGEVVLALREWVISKNLFPEDNLAEHYLQIIQKNKTTLDSIDNTIKKYNQSLDYIKSGSYDLAIINLKKIVAINPKFIRAYLLLALLNVKMGDNTNAKRELQKVLNIDATNRLARRYFTELVQKDGEEKVLSPEEENKKIAQKNQKQIVINQGLQQVATLVLGVLLGAGLLYFLVWPYQKSQIVDNSETLKKEIAILQEENNALRQENENAKKEVAAKEEQVKAMVKEVQMSGQKSAGSDGYIVAAGAYFANDLNAAAEALSGIVRTENPTLDNAVEQLKQLVYPKVSQTFYLSGYRAYSKNSFEAAVKDLTLAVKYDSGTDFNDDALYFLGRTYEKSGEKEKALETFRLLLEKYPASDKRGYAEGLIKSLSR